MLQHLIAMAASATGVLTPTSPTLPTMLEVLFGTALILCLAATAILGLWLIHARRIIHRNRAGHSASLRASGMANWEWDPDQGEILVLGEFHKIMGTRAPERPGKSTGRNIAATSSTLDRGQFLEMVHPDDRGYVQKALEDALDRNRAMQLEHRVRLADGTIRHVAHSGSTVDLPGEAGRFYAVVRDVTTQRAHDRKLERSRERFLGLFKGLPLSAAIWQRQDDRFILLEISDEADLLTLSGLRLYLGRPLSEAAQALHPEYVARVEQCFEQKTSIRNESTQAQGSLGAHRHLLTHFQYLAPDMVAVYSLDLTERRRTEEALKENELRLRMLGDNLPGGALFQAERSEGMPVRLTYVSGSLFRLMGRRPDEVVGRTLGDLSFLHAEDLPRITITAAASARNLTLIDTELRLLGADGTTFWVRACASPREAHNNRIVWDGFVIDISRLKHIEDALRDSENRLRTLGDNLPGGAIFQIERNSRGRFHFPYMSAGFKGLTGRLPENAMAKAAEAFAAMHPEDLPHLLAHLEESARSLTSLDQEYRLIHSDGRPLWCRASMVPRKTGDGVVTWDGFIIDITVSRQAQNELRTVLEDSPAPIVRVKLGPEGDNRICYLNPVARELFGKDAMGQPCRDYICGSDRCAALEAPKGKLDNVPCTMRCKDGPRQAIRNVQLTEDGHVIEVLMDMTDQIKAQQALREARDTARAASRIKDEFLANMSHEIRTPLNGVMGMLNLALDSELDPELRSLLQTAVESSRSLLGVINDILDITRIEAGKMDIQQAPFHLGDTVRALMENFYSQAMERDVRLTSDLDETLPQLLHGDRSRIMQILFNLVGNALKFTEGGEVSLHAWNVGQGRNKDNVRALFVVADTGMGIPEDKLDMVFQAFTQADGSLSRRYGGAGLGLGIVRRLVNLMSGSLAVESAPGKGTTVYVALELGCPQPLAHPASQPAERVVQPAGKRVLVAEDNTVNRILAVKLLERLGYDSESVEDGSAVVPALRQGPFDAVLMDVQMPGTNGIKATELIRQDISGEFDPFIPVIALTAHAMKGDRERFLEAGMTDYISKPLDRLALATVLERHIRSIDSASKSKEHGVTLGMA